MKPQTVQELFQFYHDYVKILYAAIEAENELPQETLFEINAAFDHLSRHWTYKQHEAYAVDKAYSHLKRSCLDIFKLFLRDAIDKYNQLTTLDTSIIDNGQYDKRMHQLIHQIKKEAKEARRAESYGNEDDETVKAFELWAGVYDKCETFNEEFYNNEHLDWARKKTRIYSTKAFILSIIASLIAGILLSPWLFKLFSKLLTVIQHAAK